MTEATEDKVYSFIWAVVLIAMAIWVTSLA